MKPPWTPRPPDATGAEAGAGADSLAGDTVSGGEAARAPGAAGDRRVPVDSAAADSLPPPGPPVEELEERGPTYVPYDVSPQLLPGNWLSELLADTLAPVVDRNEDLSVEEFALFWVLVDREGRVRDVVLHTSSRSEPFDRAARAVAERLRYRPALSDGRPLPVWILARISLLMR